MLGWKKKFSHIALSTLLITGFSDTLDAAKKRRHKTTITLPENFSKPFISRPETPKAVDDRFNNKGAAVNTLEQTLFVNNEGVTIITKETLPNTENRLALEHFVLNLTDNKAVFPDAIYRPVAIFTLPENTNIYKKWLSATNDQRRQIMIDTASQVEKSIERSLNLKTDELHFRIGYANTLQQGLNRYAQYSPYFEILAQTAGLDKRLGMLAIQETNFNLTSISKVHCEGPFQLGRYEARVEGLIVPPGKRGGNNNHVNESFHPLLAAPAAFNTVKKYSLLTGSLLSGISAYHTGPGNIAAMRALAILHPDLPTKTHKDIETAIAEYYFKNDTAKEDATKKQSTAQSTNQNTVDECGVPIKKTTNSTPESLSQLAWMINDGWKIPQNRSSYKSASSGYLPRLLAIIATVKTDEFKELHFT